MTLHILKLGGELLADDGGRDTHSTLAQRVAQIPQPPLIVHGGGKQTTALAERLGITAHFHEGRRLTDAAMLEVLVMTTAGLLNKRPVAPLQAEVSVRSVWLLPMGILFVSASDVLRWTLASLAIQSVWIQVYLMCSSAQDLCRSSHPSHTMAQVNCSTQMPTRSQQLLRKGVSLQAGMYDYGFAHQVEVLLAPRVRSSHRSTARLSASSSLEASSVTVCSRNLRQHLP